MWTSDFYFRVHEAIAAIVSKVYCERNIFAVALITNYSSYRYGVALDKL